MKYKLLIYLVSMLISVLYGIARGEPLEKISDDPDHTKSLSNILENLYGHGPFYFLYGWDPDNVKFQISFKYRILNPDGPLSRNWPGLANLYFGYTQTSFVERYTPSDPILDTSFKPELLYSQQDVSLGKISWISRLGFESGVQHESNGQSGDKSRNLNIFYIKPILAFGNVDRYHFTVAPKAWAYITNLSENPDIAEFLGYFDLELKFGKPDGLELRSNMRKGTGSGKGSIQIDFTYPLGKILSGNFNGYFLVQYFSGYGETLLHYNQKDTQFRIGFALYR
ncbi:MAG: phospholipase A [Desulfatiglandales bacterium]